MLIGKLQRDVTDDKAVLRDWDFPFIYRTVDSDSGCLETSIRMVYCAAFDCNANSSKNRVTCSWRKFPTEPTLLKKTSSRRNTAGLARFEKTVSLRSRPEKVAALCYSGAKFSLKEDDVPTVFTIVEAMLMSPIRRTQAATRASTPTVHLGSKRAVSADTRDVGSR